MEGNLIVSRADEANPTSAIQADCDMPVQAEDENFSISTRADDRNPRIPLQAEDRRPMTSFQADEDSMCVSFQAKGSIPSMAEATIQETSESMKEIQVKTSISSGTLLCDLQGGNLVCETMGSPAGETPEVEAECANAEACSNLDDEFIQLGDTDESLGVNTQTDFVGSESISTQGDLPCNKGCVDNIDDITESPNGGRRLSWKRSRSSSFDSTPCVQVIYKCLTSESKNKLKELLHQWTQWHGEFVATKEDAEIGPLESGDETYFPPLQVGGVSNSTVSFWIEKPSKQARTENTTVDSTPANQDREKEVPLYNRAGTGALISQETEMSLEGGLESMEEGSRCFNCGSYSHSLKDCPRPRDAAAINNARKLLAEKRGSANGSRSASRYYQTSPGGKFDDLKPGVLGIETRQLLGIGERDPPPWLNRMRELGYPPGYLEDQEEEHSGITIFGTNEDAEGKFIGEDGEILGENKTRSTAKKMRVHFPGVNAPIPDDADRHVWGSSADMSTQDRPSHRVVGRGVHSSYSAMADGYAYTGMEDWESSPGCGRDNYGRNSKLRSPGLEGPLLNKTPPWQPGDQSRLGVAPLPRSPHLSRSSSDSGRRSPKVAYDESHSLPPLGHFSGSRQSPSHNSRPYYSPATPNQRFPQRQDSREEESRRRAWAHAQDALFSMHHNDRYSPARRR